MDIQHIQYFLAVARHQSFSKAARALYVTQPILSRCIQNLEQELGTPLIIRSTKTFTLTDAGQALMVYGAELLQQHDDLYRRIQDVVDSQTGEIRISSPGVLLDMYFPRLVTEYRKQHPGVRITVQEKGSRSVVNDVLDGVADIGLVMLPLEDSEKLHIFPIVQDAIHVFVHKDHPFAKEKAIHISQLQNVDIITHSQSNTLYHMFIKMCHDHGFSPTIAFQSMMPRFVIDTLSYGACVGVFPAPMLQHYRQHDVISIPLLPHFPWEIAMITKKNRYISFAADSFLHFSQDFIAAKTPE